MNADNVFHNANDVTLFLTPLLGIAKNVFRYTIYTKLGRSRYINSYLMDDDSIGILLYGHQDSKFNMFDTNIMKEPTIFDKVELLEGNYILYKAALDNSDAMQKFKEGLYSKFDSEDKVQIINNCYIPIHRIELLARVLSKDDTLKTLRQQELGVEFLEHEELWSLYDETYCSLSDEVLEVLKSTINNKLTPNESDF